MPIVVKGRSADYQHCGDVNICVDNTVIGNWVITELPSGSQILLSKQL